LRLIALASTLATAALVAWFAHYLSRDRLLGAFAVACFLTGDLLTQRGWIAYSDPLFTVATFAAIVCLWIAVDRRSPRFLILAGLAITAAFLTKALTAYAFYGAAALVLLWRHENRRFLLSPASLVIHATIIAAAPF
jgi:4-amino-4-deoxy-L-arabinose transferase-like glycosyltransferase